MDLLKSLVHPSEVHAMYKLKFGGIVKKVHKEPLTVLAKTLSNVDFCYAVLNKVSRSFAVVIQALPEQLKDAVCIFYLVLRGLDSVEDDMTFDIKLKLPMLRDFHNLLQLDGWCIDNVGDGPDYRILLANFGKVISVYKGLSDRYRETIKDITARMGAGMAEFAEAQAAGGKNGFGTESISKYNLYCHYVAGLVGIGLTQLFAASGLEDPNLKKTATPDGIANSMGLFLQKTNIIRDYLEDLDQGRTWWPKEIWSLYGSTLAEFKLAPSSPASLACLNHMVADALELVPDSLDYLSRLRDQKTFEFCAIPQVMAIATLAELHNNPKVFTKVVKVRKGMGARMMLECTDMNAVRAFFRQFVSKIEDNLDKNKKDPSAARILAACNRIYQVTGRKSSAVPQLRQFKQACMVLFVIAASFWLFSASTKRIHVWTSGVGALFALSFLVMLKFANVESAPALPAKQLVVSEPSPSKLAASGPMSVPMTTVN